MAESLPDSGWAEAYYAPVYYHALKRCGNVWDAADVTQSTFGQGSDPRRRPEKPGGFGPLALSHL